MVASEGRSLARPRRPLIHICRSSDSQVPDRFVRFVGDMSTTTVTHDLDRLATETDSPPPMGRIGRIYVLGADDLAVALRELGTQSTVVPHEGRRSRPVQATTRPVCRLRGLFGRPRFVPHGDVDRTELSLATGTASIDRAPDTDLVVVRTRAPRDGSELDQILWWHGHDARARVRF